MLPRRTRWIVPTFLVLGVFAITVTPARATFVVLTNPSQFSPGSTLITFDEGDFDGHLLQPFEVVTSYRGVGFRAPGAPPGMWPQAAFDPTPPREFGPGGAAGRTILQVLIPPLPSQGLEVTLPGQVTQFGAEFKAVAAGDFTFTLFAGTQQVDVVTIPSGPAGQSYNFHAFEDSSAFDRVIIRGPAAINGQVIMDNLRFGPTGPVVIPEPSSLLLAGVGIAGLIGMARRRRRTAG